MPLRIWVIGRRSSSAPGGKAIAPTGRCGRLRRGDGGRSGGGPAVRGGRRRRAAGPDGLDHGQDVVAGDPAAAARAGDLLRAEPVLAEEPPDRWGHAGVGVAGRGERRRRGEGRRGRGGRRGGGRGGRRDRPLVGSGGAVGRLRRGGCRRCGGCRRTRLVAGVDDRDLGLVGDGLALLDQDLLEDALERRRDLGVHLVGDDLEQRLVLVDVVAGLLEPFADRALGDALAELGHRYLGHVRWSSESRDPIEASRPGRPRSVAHPGIRGRAAAG